MLGTVHSEEVTYVVLESFTNFFRFAWNFGKIARSDEPVRIRQAKAPDVVALRADEYDAITSELDAFRETEYLLSTRANAEHLARSIAELREGRGVVRELIEE